MATDTALLERWFHTRRSVLRFYGWSPGALSLGFHQRRIPACWRDMAATRGWDLVRRPTGGRAVLHGDDLTYAFVTAAPAGSRSQVYRQCCEFLRQGLEDLGVSVAFGKAGRGYIGQPGCFSTATEADLVVPDGRKLVGSAQLYRRGALLQHGSIAIAPDREAWRQVFGTEVPIVGLAELLGTSDRQGVVEAAIAALQRAAATCFGVVLESATAPP